MFADNRGRTSARCPFGRTDRRPLGRREVCGRCDSLRRVVGGQDGLLAGCGSPMRTASWHGRRARQTAGSDRADRCLDRSGRSCRSVVLPPGAGLVDATPATVAAGIHPKASRRLPKPHPLTAAGTPPRRRGPLPRRPHRRPRLRNTHADAGIVPRKRRRPEPAFQPLLLITLRRRGRGGRMSPRAKSPLTKW